MKGNEVEEAANRQPKKNGSIWVDGVLIFLLPFASVFIEHVAMQTPLNWNLFGKWFVFWAFGFRLFTAGIKQASDPASEAAKTFKLNGKNVYVIIRQLGFANISLGILGILSLINNQWRQIGAISGISFFGFAALNNITQKVKERGDIITMIWDALTSVVMLLYLFFTF